MPSGASFVPSTLACGMKESRYGTSFAINIEQSCRCTVLSTIETAWNPGSDEANWCSDNFY